MARGESGASEEPSETENYAWIAQRRVLGEILRWRLTSPYFQLLIKRELHSYMRNAQETWEQPTVKGSDAL